MKGFMSQDKILGIVDGFTAEQSETRMNHMTIQPIHGGRMAMDNIYWGSNRVVVGDLAEANSSDRHVVATGHLASKGDFIYISSGTNAGEYASIIHVDANNMILGRQLPNAMGVGDAFDVYSYVPLRVDASGAQLFSSSLNVVDLFDTPLLDVNAAVIPASGTLGATARTEVVANLAAACSKITIAEDIGEYIGIYTGAANAEVLKCVLPLGGGEMNIDFAAGDRISLGHMKNTTIATATFMAITFLG